MQHSRLLTGCTGLAGTHFAGMKRPTCFSQWSPRSLKMVYGQRGEGGRYVTTGRMTSMIWEHASWDFPRWLLVDPAAGLKTPTCSHAQEAEPRSSAHHRHAQLTSRLRSRFEALPPSILEEAHTLREQMRYFLTSNGHAHGLDDMAPNVDDKVPHSLRELFDEISQDAPADGSRFGARMQEEIWEDDYTRNVSSITVFPQTSTDAWNYRLSSCLPSRRAYANLLTLRRAPWKNSVDR